MAWLDSGAGLSVPKGDKADNALASTAKALPKGDAPIVDRGWRKHLEAELRPDDHGTQRDDGGYWGWPRRSPGS